jgi:uncharacterized protein (TIGR02271 family)
MTDTMQKYQGWVGRTAVDPSGEKVGTIKELYSDDATGVPEWVAVSTGLLGTRVSFAPISGATAEGDDLRLTVTKDQVKDAPNVEADGHLEPAEEAELYRYYGRGDDYESGWDTKARHTTGRDTSGPTTDDAMTRSEEELQVDKRSREAGRARLRKYVVTEDVNVTVPVQREEVRVEREPITDANRDAAMSGPDISEEEHEVILNEEEVVVGKQTVPKERVRLDKDVVTDQKQVSEKVRKEQIDVDTDAGTKRKR